MLLEVLISSFMTVVSTGMSTQDIFIFAENGSALPVCHLQSAAASVEGLLVGSEIVAVVDRGLCSRSSPVLINFPCFARSCL